MITSAAFPYEKVARHGRHRLASPLSSAEFAQLVDAARDMSRVDGLTHNFYRYPARFSPQFVRGAIELLTNKGDTVLDPFVGGGTTLVEAMALGRHAVGTDISSLATFVSRAKTLVLSNRELAILEAWAADLPNAVNSKLPAPTEKHYAEAGYHKHLGTASAWRIKRALDQVLATTRSLRTRRLVSFARCVALRTGQWALDGRKHLPSIDQFRQALCDHANEMLMGALELRSAVERHDARPKVSCRHRSIIGIESENPCQTSPRLVLTSPPYPGVHVLYHRWQIGGGRETAAPFWLANSLDGSGAAYYTLGDRHARENRTYFQGIRSALASIARLCDRNTTIVQVVAFSDPETQVQRYLSSAEEAGLSEIPMPPVQDTHDGRLWRSIPNRKWHAQQRGETSSSKEVVLFHRLSV